MCKIQGLNLSKKNAMPVRPTGSVSQILNVYNEVQSSEINSTTYEK